MSICQQVVKKMKNIFSYILYNEQKHQPLFRHNAYFGKANFIAPATTNFPLQCLLKK